MEFTKQSGTGLDIIGLLLAGLINTFLALFVAVIILGPGSISRQPEVLIRAEWIATHPLRWKVGWLFWFAVTLTFSWSYFALGRHFRSRKPWVSLAVGVALIAAAVDIVGILHNLIILPEFAGALQGTAPGQRFQLLSLFVSMESMANALTNVVAYGLYSLAGLLLLPAAFATPDYKRGLAWLGAAEWCIAVLATILLTVAPQFATFPLLISFALYAPWVWGSALWLRRKSDHV
jgi:hypothetical protein